MHTVPMTLPRILHITADFPDAFSSQKTSAIRNLIKGSEAFSHLVYSINRESGFGGVTCLDCTDGTTTLTYRAPPFGLLLDRFLIQVADWIIQDVRERGIEIDLIHGHKLTIEGVVARHVARALGCPFVCTVRGNTDQKYMRMRPDLRPAWRRMASEAAWLFPVTPWIESYLMAALSLDDPPRSLLPTISKIDRVLSPRTTSPHLVSAFHLAGWRLKGMPNLFKALARLNQEGLRLELDIIGGNNDGAAEALMRMVKRLGLEDQVRLLGAVSHSEMLERFNGYGGFVLPTLRETFGMVYLEALFAGVPILYSQDRGIDGFFDGLDVGIRCNPKSIESIAAGLKELNTGAGRMKEAIAHLQHSGGLDRFRQQHVCKDYVARIRTILSGRVSSAPGA